MHHNAEEVIKERAKQTEGVSIDNMPGIQLSYLVDEITRIRFEITSIREILEYIADR